MRLNETPVIQKRYVQLLRLIQCIHLAFLATLLYQAFTAEGPLDVLNGGVISNLGMLLFVQFLIFHIKKGRTEIAVTIHQLVSLFFIVVQLVLYGGGFAKPSVAALHLPLLIISIYGRQITFRIFFVIIISIVLFIGLNEVNSWVFVKEVDAVGEPNKVVSFLLIYFYAGILSWFLIRDLKFAYTSKIKERERIRKAKNEIQALADSDQLTGLLSRYGAYNKFDCMMKNTDFKHSSLLLLFIDVDDFKLINDQYGHLIGDAVLIRIGERLRAVAGESTLVSRLGGDEFVIVLKRKHSFDLNNFLDKVMVEVAKPFRVEGVAVEITSSIGIALATNQQNTFDELSRKADMAMYKAKVEGKNDYCYYGNNLEQIYMANLKLIESLKKAIDKNGLILHYQPKFNTKTNQIVGAEALLRWEKHNPNGNKADQIISVIETTNLIHSIGYWTIRKACQDCKQWQSQGADLPVSVNVSSKQFSDEKFAVTVQNILEDVGLSPSSLMLEISENTLAEKGSEVMEQLQQLKGYGVKLAIDKFGVGHSNLIYLADLKIDELKMDRGFTQKLAQNPKARFIVTAFVKMASQLGMSLVALGVEKQEDNRTLQALGCGVGQGFLWQKPVTAKEFGKLLP